MTPTEPKSARAARLAGWLESWRHPGGGVHGPVIHRFRIKRMWAVHDTAWTQAAIIRGYASWLARGESPVWRARLEAAADAQCGNLLPESGKFRRAGHEDERFCSLVHCALADVALLQAARLVDAGRRARYEATARANLDRYCLPSLWVQAEGAFRFSEVDHWSPHEDRFVLNFNTMAAEALLECHAVSGEPRYRELGLQVGEWLLRQAATARDHHQRLLANRQTAAERPGSEWMAPGGLPYQVTPSRRDPDNCVLIYSGLALRGFAALYRATADERYAEVLREVAGFLLAMRDPDTGLFPHTTDGGRVVRWPQFVAGAGMILTGLDEARRTLRAAWDWSDTEAALLARQYPNGSFPGFLGKAAPERVEVWEDAMATPNWNAQLFEYLARVTDPPDGPLRAPPFRLGRPGFRYADTPSAAWVVAWRPFGFAVLYLVRKRSGHALCYLPLHRLAEWWRDYVARYPRAVYRRARGLWHRVRRGTPS